MSKEKNSLNPIEEFLKLAKKKKYKHKLKEGCFITAMGFQEFPSIEAQIQASWHNEKHLTVLLIIDYVPKLAEACGFRDIINNLNDELWGVTYVWKEGTSQIHCKVLETPSTFSQKDAEALLKQLNYFSRQLLDCMYPRDPKAQAEWQRLSEQRQLLMEAEAMGHA